MRQSRAIEDRMDSLNDPQDMEVHDDPRRGPGFMASPAIDGKGLILRTRHHLYRIEDRQGHAGGVSPTDSPSRCETEPFLVNGINLKPIDFLPDEWLDICLRFLMVPVCWIAGSIDGWKDQRTGSLELLDVTGLKLAG